MGKRIDMIGKRFGRLIVVSESHKNKHGHTYFKCECDCGLIKVILGVSLRCGATKSCGCLWLENHKNIMEKHGFYKHPLYHVWLGIKNRCNNIEYKEYYHYGGRGITICDEWNTNDPTKFIEWSVSNGWKKGLEIDRINNDGNYEPSNCRFTTSSENSINTRKRRTNTSGYTGISWNKQINKYRGEVTKDGISIRKYFNTKKEALEFRNSKITEMGWSHKIQEYKGE